MAHNPHVATASEISQTTGSEQKLSPTAPEFKLLPRQENHYVPTVNQPASAVPHCTSQTNTYGLNQTLHTVATPSFEGPTLLPPPALPAQRTETSRDITSLQFLQEMQQPEQGERSTSTTAVDNRNPLLDVIYQNQLLPDGLVEAMDDVASRGLGEEAPHDPSYALDQFTNQYHTDPLTSLLTFIQQDRNNLVAYYESKLKDADMSAEAAEMREDSSHIEANRLRNELNNARKALATLTEKLYEPQLDDIRVLNTQIKILQEKLVGGSKASMSTAAAEEIVKLREENARLKMELRTIRPEIEIKASEEAARLRGILRTKEYQLGEADQDNSELRPLRGVVKNLKKKVLKATLFAVVMVSALRIREKQLSQLTRQNEQLQMRINSVQTENDDFEKQNDDLRDENSEPREELGEPQTQRHEVNKIAFGVMLQRDAAIAGWKELNEKSHNLQTPSRAEGPTPERQESTSSPIDTENGSTENIQVESFSDST
jgi:predicted  nucleic acid-binding Zn-ribbon protein